MDFKRTLAVTILIVTFGTLALIGASAEAQESRIVIKTAADIERFPALIPLPAHMTGTKGIPIITPPGQDNAVPGQIVEIEGQKYVAAMLPGFKRNSAGTYSLSFTDSKRTSNPVRLSKQSGRVSVAVRGSHLASHIYEGAHKPYLWPIHAPNNINITRNFPMLDVDGEDKDHPHQRSMWFTHGDVNGTDFWHEGDNAGRINQTSLNTENGPALARISFTADWVIPDGTKLLEEKRTMLFWDSNDPRVIDYFITLTANDQPVTFGDTKEGSFGIRVPRWMTVRAGTGKIINSNGQEDNAAWGQLASWVSYYGTDSGQTAGVAIITHPDTFRYPIYWHARDYGLFAANPFGIRDFTGDQSQDGSYTLQPGESMHLRFRVLVHSGTTEDANIRGFAQQTQLQNAYTVISR